MNPDQRDNHDYKQYLKENGSAAAYKFSNMTKNVFGMFGTGKDGNSSGSGGDPRQPGVVGHSSDSP